VNGAAGTAIGPPAAVGGPPRSRSTRRAPHATIDRAGGGRRGRRRARASPVPRIASGPRRTSGSPTRKGAAGTDAAGLVAHWATQWGYLGVVLAMALESACVPVPSEVVLPFAGYLAGQGRFTFAGAVLAGLAGQMLGSVAAYAVGYHGGRALLVRYGPRWRLGAHELRRAEAWVARYGDFAAFAARLLPGVRTFVSLPIGVARMRLDRFIGFSLLGALPWTAALVYAGFFLGARWDTLGPAFHRFSLLVAAALLVLAAVWLGVRRGRRPAEVAPPSDPRSREEGRVS
jgi:membrane protein DedA with SNARE-associated domain